MYTILSRLMIFLCLAIIVIAAFFWYIPLIKQNESMYRSLLQLEESLMKENERGIKLDNERTLIKRLHQHRNFLQSYRAAYFYQPRNQQITHIITETQTAANKSSAITPHPPGKL